MLTAPWFEPGERLEWKILGDYWEGEFVSVRRTGTFWFTNRRLYIQADPLQVNLPYTALRSVAPCNVGPMVKFLPTGIRILLQDGTVHQCSFPQRERWLAYLRGRLQPSGPVATRSGDNR